jgi:hypothetical protein
MLCFSAPSLAQRLDAPATRDVYFTFSQPVMVPATTLPAGKYLFRVVGDGRTIVQIYTGDRSKLVHTAMTVQTMRADQPERPEIRLIEGAADGPVAIGTWWYPEMRQGWEFVYPREQAMKLAKTAEQPILTTAENVAAGEMDSAELVRLEPSGQQSAYAASKEPGAVTGMAQVGEVAGSTAAADAAANRVANQMAGAGSTQARSTLPKTASQTPTVALAGLLAFAAACGLRVWRRIA